MKKVLFSVLLAIVSIAQITASNAPLPSFSTDCFDHLRRTVTLKSGTQVVMEVIRTYSSESVQEGTMIQMRVRYNVYAEKKVVIRKNTLATGRVKSVRRSTPNSPGMIEVDVTEVESVDKQPVQIGLNFQSNEEGANGQPAVFKVNTDIYGFVTDTIDIDYDNM
jgi:hypothetical protein